MNTSASDSAKPFDCDKYYGFLVHCIAQTMPHWVFVRYLYHWPESICHCFAGIWWVELVCSTETQTCTHQNKRIHALSLSLSRSNGRKTPEQIHSKLITSHKLNRLVFYMRCFVMANVASRKTISSISVFPKRTATAHHTTPEAPTFT